MRRIKIIAAISVVTMAVNVLRSIADGFAVMPMWQRAAILIIVVVATMFALSLFFPRLSTRASRLMRQLNGPCVLILGVALAIACIVTALGGRDETTVAGIPIVTPSPDAVSFSPFYTAAQFFLLNADPSEYEKNSPWAAWCVEILAPMLFLLVTIQTIGLLFHDSLSMLRLAFVRDHVVVCGVGRIGHQLVEDLASLQGDRREIVVIEHDPEHPDLPWLREQGVIVVIGKAQRADVLRKSKACRAREVFVVTGSDEINVECVVELRDQMLAEDRTKALRCYVHLRDRELAASMRERLQCSTVAGRERCRSAQRWIRDRLLGIWWSACSLIGRAKPPCDAAANLEIEVFNSGERTVRHLFEWMASRASDQLPTKDDEVAHFVIVGFGEFGQSLAVSLAELGHFPNCKRLRMTIVDRDIESKKRVFLARYPRFTHPEGVEPQDCWHHGTSGGIEYVCNATFESVDDVGDPEFVTRLDRRLGRKGVKPLVFVCFDNESINFKQAERLRRMRDRLGDRFDAAGREIGSPRVKQDRWRILVWIPAQRELSDLLESSTPPGAASQRAGCPDPVPFGHCFGAVSYHEVTNSWSDRLAMILKYGYEGCADTRATPSTGAEPADGWPDLARLVSGLPCRSLPPEKSSLTWEDHVNRARAIWRESPEAYRASDRSAAIHAVVKMAALGFAIHGRHAAPNQDADRAKERVREIVNKVKIFKDIKIDWDRGIKPSVSNQAAQQPVANLEKLPVMEHYRWCAERLLAGWSYAAQPPTKDMERDVKYRQFKHWNLVTADALHTLPGNSGRDGATTSDVVTLDYAPVHILLALAADGRLFDIGWISAGTGGADAVGNA